MSTISVRVCFVNRTLSIHLHKYLFGDNAYCSCICGKPSNSSHGPQYKLPGSFSPCQLPNLRRRPVLLSPTNPTTVICFFYFFTANMSVDTINDVLGASIDGPNGQLNFSFVDNFKTLADQPGLFQFGLACPDFDLCLNSPPAWLNDRGDCARHEEEAESHVVSSVDRDPPTNGDQALSPSSDSSNSSDLFFLSCSTPPSSVPSIPQDPFWDDKKNTSFTNGGGEAMDVAMDLHGSSFSFLGRDCESISRERGRDLSLVNPNFSEPTMAQGGSTPTQNAPAGWTYRQVLEVVAFPPPGAPHLWNAKVSQLTAELGMPSGSTGTDIVTFVMRIAIMKNELDKVTPLIKAFAAASRVLEGRVAASGVLGSIVHSLYAGPTYMGLQPAGADLNCYAKGVS
ncbi:hypothetical protein F5148DRAFT_417073 [Russula earlei]|uniref:Uncharacterized protein n=1 Tax=Russula earlei TaxID=71964 RepID=A0ACC0TZL8_9AGAM|nr:hypothetical protein F5148DRAFT_417073 [Russula earlei]